MKTPTLGLIAPSPKSHTKCYRDERSAGIMQIKRLAERILQTLFQLAERILPNTVSVRQSDIYV